MHFVPVANPDDPTCIVVSALDVPVLVGPLSKERREDLQMLGFADAVASAVQPEPKIAIAYGGDPPDRVVTVGGLQLGVELTQLTSADIRIDLARAREVGRALATELGRDHVRYRHLLGRCVSLAVNPVSILSHDKGDLLRDLCEALVEDRGCVGVGVVGLPQRWPNSNGFYGQHGPANLTVNRLPGLPRDSIVVSATSQATIRVSEIVARVEELVHGKDRSENDVLVISCAAPDERGYVCPADRYMFQFLRKEAHRVTLRPANLKGVFVHHWNTAEIITLYRRDDTALPWPPRG